MTGRTRYHMKTLVALTAALVVMTVATMSFGRVPVYAQAAGTAPYWLTAVVLNEDQITISWQSDRTDITGWNVARNGQDDRGSGPWNTNVAATVRTYTFNLLVAGFDYTFTLTPLTATGAETPVTVVANTRPTSTPTPTAAPTYSLTAVVLNEDQITISWQSDRTDITGWNVARNGQDDRGSGPWNTNVAATVRTYTFNLLVAGFDYTFTLTPLTAAGAETPVTVVANTTQTPGTPTPTPTVPPTTSDTAAARFGWGTPLPASDEFNYTGTPNTALWSLAGGGAGLCWPGHNGNGRRCDANSRVNGSALVQTGSANGDTGWLASELDQQYGRWEARVRSFNTGANNGRQYHPLLIIWPYRENWPEDGEYDFLENGAPGQTCAEAFIHYPHPASVPVQQEHATETNCGAPLSEWHNIAVDWQPTGIKGYINGVQWFSYSGGGGPNGRSDIQAMPSGHLTIQLDNFYGGNMTPASYEIDWVRIYQP